MIETSIRSEDLTDLLKRVEGSGQVLRQARKKALEAAAPKMKGELDRHIGGMGKVRGWQEKYIGSGGGYAAIRPRAKSYTQPNGRGKRYAVGYVTNAINEGHRFPTPSGKRGYTPRIRIPAMKVPGRKFYQAAQAALPSIAREAARQVTRELTQHLEG